MNERIEKKRKTRFKAPKSEHHKERMNSELQSVLFVNENEWRE